MFLSALSVQSAAEDFIFHILDRFVVSAVRGTAQALGNLKSEISELGPDD